MRWAARLFRQAVSTTVAARARKKPKLRFLELETRANPDVSGTVFLDLDGDGIQGASEIGLGGVTVSVTGADAPVVTDTDGSFTIATTATSARLEFSNLPDGVLPGRVAGTAGAAGPMVRFLDASGTVADQNLAVNPVSLATSLFYFDDATVPPNDELFTIVSSPYGSNGTTTPDGIAQTKDVGSTWGLAYQPSSDSIFASAFLKRHSGLGTSGTGAIYRINRATNAVSLLIDLDADPNINTGTATRNGSTEYDVDGGVIGQIGKVSLGGIALSPDGRTLYAISLNDRQLIEIPLTAAGAVDSAGTIRRVPTPTANPGGLSAFNAANMRPFALTVRNGVVFVGVTYTAEGGAAADLRAIVYAYDPTTHTFRAYNQSTNTFSGSTATPVLTANLNYTRPQVDPNTTTDTPGLVSGNWRAWNSTFPTDDEGVVFNPQPWLTGIAFDGDAMVLGLRDRFGDQSGFATRGPTSTDPGDPTFFGITYGDTLRATASGAGWTLSTATEFYTGDDAGTDLPEATTGAVTQVPGFGTIATTGNNPDPASPFSGGIFNLRNSDGTSTNRAELFLSGGFDTFGNSNGLGGLIALAATGTIQAGDRIFQDTNNNGIQDPTETGIANVTLGLFRNGTQVTTATTDTNGVYAFNNLDPNTTYEIRISTTQTALTGRTLSTANQGTNDGVDSDAVTSGSNAVITFTTGIAGTNVHSLDAGFGTGGGGGTTTLTLGGTIFRDVNNNGVIDTGDTGITGVSVELLNSAGATTGRTTTTDASGNYSFNNLTAGGYQVRIVSSNFQSTGNLFGAGSSGVTATNPDNDNNTDDNGIVVGTLGAADGVVRSNTINLVLNAEPTNDGDTDANTNLTLDFGITPASQITAVTLGGTIWLDANQNSALDSGESGIANVAIELLDGTGNPTGQSTTTNGSGAYSFTGLVNGNYRVRLSSSNFTGAGVLAGLNSSATFADAENNVNNDNNGQVSGTLGSGGVVQSSTITLSRGGEPTDDGDGDVNTNLSLDMGMIGTLANGPMNLGDSVFLDVNNNGVRDGAETGIAGVAVDLVSSTGIVIRSTTTDTNGVYAFTSIAAGDYRVRLSASNFNTGGALFGHTSSTGGNGVVETSATDPDNNTDNDDNGAVSGTLGSNGVIESPLITLAEGTEPGSTSTNNTLDFGVFRRLSIGNIVFNDLNDDGTQGSGENGIPGVTVRLLDSTGVTQIATTTTNGTGQYLFTNLLPGSYVVELADSNFRNAGVLTGFVSSVGTANAFEPTTPTAPTATDGDDSGTTVGTLGQANGVIRTGVIVLAEGTAPTGETPSNDSAIPDNNSNLAVDFGVRFPAQAGTLSLGDRVFEDTNNNGTLDGTETGRAGVVLELLNSTGSVIRSAVTDATGLYRFINLPAGDYQVQLADDNFLTGGTLVGFTSSTGGTADPDNNTNNNDDGSVPVGLTLGQPNGVIRSGFITLTANGEPTTDGDSDANTNLTLDFGVVAPARLLTIGGTIWNDVNNNGRRDGTGPTLEAGVAGVFVQLVNSAGTVVRTGTTNAQGDYSFDGLTAGDYRVRMAANNFSTPNALVGFTSSTGTNGSSVGPFEGSQTPDPDANATDSDDNGQVSGALGTTGFIETAPVTLSVGGEPIDDGDTSSDTNFSVDMGVYRALTIGDLVFRDTNNNGVRDTGETGISGVSLRLLGPGDTLVTTTTTDTAGAYSFRNLIAGAYTVEVAASNFNAGGVLFNFGSSTGTANAFEPAPTTATNNQDHGTTTGTLGAGGTVRSGTVTLTTANDASIDFGMFQALAATASIAGRVFLDYNNSGTFAAPDTGISGVTVTLTGGNLTTPLTLQTDAQGNFKFTNLAAGTYTLTQTQPTTPATQTGKDGVGSTGGTVSAANTISNITLATNEQATNYRFAEIPLRTVTGVVFEDTDGDGVRDTGEPGISGVTITLTGTSIVTGAAITPRTATTNTDGTYTFDNVVPGTYTIAETQPTGFIDGREQNGTPAAGTVENDRFRNINLTSSAASATGYNFGELKTSSFAGLVYEDTNNNGTQETGENGIPGVTIRLTGSDDRGQSVNLTTTTGTDGAFSFLNLRPGTYSITETQPTGYADGIDSMGTVTGAVQQDRFAGIPLGSGVTATAYRFGERPATDVVLTRTASATRINPNGTVTLTYTVRNAGTLSASAVEVQFGFSGMTFVSANPTADFNSTTRKWTVGDLAGGATETLEITLRGSSAGRFAISAVASTTTGETVTTNNSAPITIQVGTPVTPPPVVPVTRRWFLSSGTTARKR